LVVFARSVLERSGRKEDFSHGNKGGMSVAHESAGSEAKVYSRRSTRP
jgi:hypothetical protein